MSHESHLLNLTTSHSYIVNRSFQTRPFSSFDPLVWHWHQRSLQWLHLAPQYQFPLRFPTRRSGRNQNDIRATPIGITSMQLDNVRQRFAIYSQANRRIAIVDLDQHTDQQNPFQMIADVPQYPPAYFMVSRLFVSSGFDSKVKIWDSNVLECVYEFNLVDAVGHHCMSPIATSHTLIACSTDGPAVRLCDINSGAFSHTLAGHRNGAVKSLAWSPRSDYILLSGGSDGTIRFWDIRKANSCYGSIYHAHDSKRVVCVNGLTYLPDGHSFVSTADDDRLQLWDAYTGANLGVNYGSHFSNKYSFYLQLAVSPLHGPKRPVLFIPSDNSHLLMYDAVDGRLLQRLKGHLGRVSGVSCRVTNYEPRIQVFSYGPSNSILTWEPRLPSGRNHENPLQNSERPAVDEDDWSDAG